ncbi:serine hydrolase domain-containing protein [uncultured Flavobacterium sp.]|uniref:serine hydrolase domain-containing protein n=1 Tax=uncultured Flavobacterium sp. TaxID=165435 RepID=UPI0030ECA6D9
MKNPIYIILLLILLSCKDDTKNSLTHNYVSYNDIENDSLPKSIFSELPEEYIQQKSFLVESFFKAHINNNQDFNGGFLVAKNGQIIFEKYQGKSNFSTNEDITETTALHLASISKVLTATAIFKLVDAEKLTLDEKVKTILPSFPYLKITVRMLLNHRSGLAQYSRFTEPDNIWGKKKTLHNSDILSLLGTKSIPLEFQPNTKFAYCNTNYAILALIIENLTSQKYPEAMQSLVFKPLKMNNTFVFEFEKDKDIVSQTYKSTKEKIRYDQLDAVYGDKNIYSTPQDLLKFDLATYKPDFISEDLKKEIYKGYSYEKKGIKNYGLGIRLREWDSGQKVFYHNGWWHGNTSSYITLKNDTVTMIALSNKYSRKVYQTMKASALFGDYPFKLNEESE